MKNPIVTFEMENGGSFKCELYPEIAPESVGNFVHLVKQGFYDGLIFHRVISGFMIQGGDPTGTGMGGPGWKIKGEFDDNLLALMPGERRTIVFTPAERGVSFDAFRKSLSVSNLYGAKKKD